MALRNKTKTPTPAKPTNPRTALARALDEAGEIVASACGTCGAQVAADDPQGEQTHQRVGNWPSARHVRSWRYHRVCRQAGALDAGLLAFLLSPDERPIRVTQAHADVARQLGVPLRYAQVEGTSHADSGRGKRRFQHVERAKLEELRAAVERRQRELTEPVVSPTGWPCAVCGRSHELLDRWGSFEGRPVCAACAQLVARSSPRMPGNRRLEEYALDAARPFIPAGRDINKFCLARDMPSASRPACEVAAVTPPWAYLEALPEWPLTDEERLAARLADLEARMGAAA